MKFSPIDAASPISLGNAPLSGAEAAKPESEKSIYRLLPFFVLAGGFALRLFQAQSYFLDPDEALHYLLATHNSFSQTYQATLTTAHPPLLIFLLHYWRWLGQSELMLRLPSLLAGTASCWLVYLWLRKVTDRSTAFIGLLLLAFSPALIELSAQVRQYALLMFFQAACLYLSERAIEDDSLLFMNAFSLSMYGALLTHYSSLLFAFSMGVYMLVRLYPYSRRPRLVAAWGGGQLIALALSGYFLLTHLPRLKQAGLPQAISETWLRKSIYHSDQNNLFLFPAQQTLRVFTYTFSHGLLGTVALLVFLAGIVALLRAKSSSSERMSGRTLAFLIVLPFVVNCATAMAGVYPYGATRHNSYLAVFAITGISIGLTLWRPKPTTWRTAVIVLCLAICNLFPAPPPLIRARSHKRTLMTEAVTFLRESAAPGSIIFADYESGLLLGYYACGHSIVQDIPPLSPFAKANCGSYTVITAEPQEWKFGANDFSGQFLDAARTFAIAPATPVWLFDAGWIEDSTPALREELAQFGCPVPRSFGKNILVCQVFVSSEAVQASPRK